MNYVEIGGEEYGFCRTPKGSYRDKFNRAFKLATQFDALSAKFDGMFKRGGGVTDIARCALACKLMLYTGIRIGNEDSAEGYITKPHPNSKKEPEFVKTYGLTTILPEHVLIKGRCVYLNFIGKKQVANSFILKGLLAQQVKHVLESVGPGETLLDISAYTLTKFVKKYVGDKFMPKDFRTLRANMCAWNKFEEISHRPQPKRKRDFNAEVAEIAEYVSTWLNNTPGVCKKSYIDPLIWDEFASVRGY